MTTCQAWIHNKEGYEGLPFNWNDLDHSIRTNVSDTNSFIQSWPVSLDEFDEFNTINSKMYNDFTLTEEMRFATNLSSLNSAIKEIFQI